jgi:RimJ/RimL family protein N-acetyltransferase
MKVEIREFNANEWYRYAEEAHKLVFKKQRDPWIDRITFAWLAYTDSGAIGYVTCRELDCHSLYWQFGGSFDERRGIPAVRAFEAILEKAKDKYRRVTTLVENDNVNYLHLLMRKGFRVIGLRVFEGNILLELLINFTKES